MKEVAGMWDGFGVFGEAFETAALVVRGVDRGVDGGVRRGVSGTAHLIADLGECSLGGAGCTSFRSDLCPSFPKQVAEFPTGLHGRPEKLFICGFPFFLILAKAE